jgi:hypothetical protein
MERANSGNEEFDRTRRCSKAAAHLVCDAIVYRDGTQPQPGKPKPAVWA